MTRILLTGGSGFIAAHVLDTLLARGHSVVTTVRSKEKGVQIQNAHPNVDKSNLDYVVVEDIAQAGAFDEAVISETPFKAVIHTASPYHFNSTNARDLLDPAIIGTTGILRAIKKNAPTVERVVLTSSAAAITDPAKTAGKTYSEADWNPITEAEAGESPSSIYRASKTFAERAAWDFMEKENPSFTLAVMNPPLVFGPVADSSSLTTLSNLNTSNQRIRNLMIGASKQKCPPTGNFLFVDVRDIALAHALAAEKPEAAGQRFFIVGERFCNKEIAEIIDENFPDLKDGLPTGEALRPGDFPEAGTADFDNRRSVEVLGMKYRSLKESIVDTVRSLQAVGEN